MSWLVFVILYVIFTVILDQSYRITAQNTIKHGALTVLTEFFGALIVICFTPFFEIKFPSDYKVYICYGMAIIFYAISDRGNTTVRSGVEASTFSILRQLSNVFMIFAGILFFKEEFVLLKIIGAFLIIFSNILIFYKKKKCGKPNKYLLLGILTNICYSVGLFLDVNVSDNFSLPIYTAISLSVASVLIFLGERIKFSDLKVEFNNTNKKVFFVSAFSWGVSVVCLLRAYQLGKVAIVAPLCALSVILNTIVGFIFFKERDNMKKKVIAGLLIILGITLIKI